MPFPASVFARSGKFTEIAPIGRGAAGQVYVARDNLDRLVAVKEALPTQEGFDRIRAKFEKESRLQASLNHTHIVRVYHLEDDPQTRELYLVCEYASAGSLAEMLEQRGPLPQAEALAIAIDLCAALEETERQQIVHRDIKPSNILLASDAQEQLTAKLGDFGIAQDRKLRRTTILPGSTHPGTPLYMAPEQADGTALLDTRTDIYALGMTLWEMLTGTDYKMLLRDNNQPDIRMYNAQAHPDIGRIVQRATRPDPAERYQTPQELRADLERVRDGKRPLAAGRVPRRRGSRQRSVNLPRPALFGAGLFLLLVGIVWSFVLLQGSVANSIVQPPQRAEARPAAAGSRDLRDTIALVTPRSGEPVRVWADTARVSGIGQGRLYFRSDNGGGMHSLPFAEIQQFRVVPTDSPQDVRIQATLRSGTTVEGVDHMGLMYLEGQTLYGAFQLRMNEIEQVEFVPATEQDDPFQQPVFQPEIAQVHLRDGTQASLGVGTLQLSYRRGVHLHNGMRIPFERIRRMDVGATDGRGHVGVTFTLFDETQLSGTVDNMALRGQQDVQGFEERLSNIERVVLEE